VADRVAHDVRDVTVHQRVGDLAAAAAGVDQARGTQHLEVLAHERLRNAERVDELVHAQRCVGEQVDDGQADRRGDGPQEVTGLAVVLDVDRADLDLVGVRLDRVRTGLVVAHRTSHARMRLGQWIRRASMLPP